jgi:hypothetical protein
MSRRAWLIVAAAGVAVVGGLVWAVPVLLERYSATGRTLDELRSLPLVSVLVADVPGAEDRLRRAIEAEQRQPTLDGPSRPLVAIGELRREYVVPALRAADDAPLATAMAARAELVRHLQQTNPAACREFSVGGIRRVDMLDTEGQRRFRDVLAAVEAAYRSGRAYKGEARPVADREQFMQLLREAGFDKADFDRLNSFATLSNEVSCALEFKVNLALPRLPADKRGPFARFVLAN